MQSNLRILWRGDLKIAPRDNGFPVGSEDPPGTGNRQESETPALQAAISRHMRTFALGVPTPKKTSGLDLSGKPGLSSGRVSYWKVIIGFSFCGDWRVCAFWLYAF